MAALAGGMPKGCKHSKHTPLIRRHALSPGRWLAYLRLGWGDRHSMSPRAWSTCIRISSCRSSTGISNPPTCCCSSRPLASRVGAAGGYNLSGAATLGSPGAEGLTLLVKISDFGMSRTKSAKEIEQDEVDEETPETDYMTHCGTTLVSKHRWLAAGYLQTQHC
jgi:hypothetical protein